MVALRCDIFMGSWWCLLDCITKLGNMIFQWPAWSPVYCSDCGVCGVSNVGISPSWNLHNWLSSQNHHWHSFTLVEPSCFTQHCALRSYFWCLLQTLQSFLWHESTFEQLFCTLLSTKNENQLLHFSWFLSDVYCTWPVYVMENVK